MGTNTAQESGHRSSESRTNSWEKNPSKAFVYDPSNHKLSTDYLSTLDSQSIYSFSPAVVDSWHRVR
jgi:hypothetical protein